MEELLDTFTSWFRQNGGYLHPSVELASDRERGIYMRRRYNSAAIDPYTKVVQCPHSLTISALDGLHLIWPDGFLQQARPQTVGAACLLRHYTLGESSFWSPYINILPRENFDTTLNTPMYFDDQDRKWLAGTNVDKGAHDLRQIWQGEWEKWHLAMQHPTYDTSWPSYEWAMSIFGSRAFPSRLLGRCSADTANKNIQTTNGIILEAYDPHVLLYPMIDSMNHNPYTHNQWDGDDEAFWIICNDKPSEGVEIFLSYGEKTNDQLLLSYGFALANNPDDAFALKPHPRSLESLSPVAHQLLGKHNLVEQTYYIRPIEAAPPHSQYPLSPPYFRTIPTRLINFLLLGLLDDEDVTVLSNSFSSFEPQYQSGQVLNFGIEVKMRLVEGLLRTFCHSRDVFEQSEEALIAGPQNSRQSFARIYRISQLIILAGNIAVLESALHTFKELHESLQQSPVENGQGHGSSWQYST